jgi:hypothetical protein
MNVSGSCGSGGHFFMVSGSKTYKGWVKICGYENMINLKGFLSESPLLI